MMYKYCAVAMGQGVTDFKDMVEFACADGYKIGLMAGDSLLVVTFVSTFSKFEVYNILEGVADINFVLTEVDENSVKFQTHNMEKKLLGIFSDLKNEDLEIESGSVEVTEDHAEAMKDEYIKIIQDMTPGERQDKVDDILDRMPDIDDNDRLFLSVISGEEKL
jgi:hypothetical protein